MKLMVGVNLGVGGLPAIDLPSDRVPTWEEDKIAALSAALADAKGRGVDACVLAGGLFARGFVAQGLLTKTMTAAGACGIPVKYVPLPGELADASDRMPSVDGVTVVMPSSEGAFEISLGEGAPSISICDGSGLDGVDEVTRPEGPVALVRSRDDIAVSLNDGRQLKRLGPLAPSGFGEGLRSGYMIVSVEGQSASAEWVDAAPHPFVVREVALEGLESSRELVTTVGEAVKDIDRNACVRIELTGRIPLDVYINTSELASQLERYFFYVEVADECELDIDVADLETDVSLLAEFVRQVVGDDSLSETEKTRVLRCGWNVLNGKEPTE